MTAFPWIVDAAAARALIAQGTVVVDARKDDLRRNQPLPGAVPLAWTRLTHPQLPDKGRLLDDDAALSVILSEVGLLPDVPVLVVTDSLAGGGEDGRLTWALRTLGHPSVALADGGVAALLAEGPQEICPARAGGFVMRRDSRWEVTREALRDAVATGAVVLLDTRERRDAAW